MNPPRSIVADSRKEQIRSPVFQQAEWLTTRESIAEIGSLGRSRGAPRIKVVEVKHGVEDQEIATHRLASPHGIVGKKNNVALAVGHIHDGGLFRDFAPGGEQGGEEENFSGRGGEKPAG